MNRMADGLRRMTKAAVAMSDQLVRDMKTATLDDFGKLLLPGYEQKTFADIVAVVVQRQLAHSLSGFRLPGVGKATAKLLKAEANLERAAAKVSSAKKPRKLQMSPARKAQLKLQGQYIGLMRGLSAMQVKVAKAVAAKHGMKAAIKHIQGLTKKG